MIETKVEVSKDLEKALKALQQAKQHVANERKKQNEKKRKAENHHKYIMGGIVVKYFINTLSFEVHTEVYDGYGDMEEDTEDTINEPEGSPTWRVQVEYSNHTVQDISSYDDYLPDRPEELYFFVGIF